MKFPSCHKQVLYREFNFDTFCNVNQFKIQVLMWVSFSSTYTLHFVFRTLRKLFKVDPADYMLSICGNDALRELSSPGKSGSFFYLTHDDRYMIKTMKKAEVKVSSTLILPCLKFLRNHDMFPQIWPCLICVAGSIENASSLLQ